MPQKIEKMDRLQGILKLLKEDTVSATEIEKFLVMVLDVIKNTKVSFDENSKKILAEMKDSLIFSQFENSKTLKQLNDENNKRVAFFDQKITDIEKLLLQVKAIKAIPGKDGKDGQAGTSADIQKIVQEVLALIPPVEIPKNIEKTPEQTRDQLESLQGDERLDVSAIKGLEKTKVDNKGNLQVIGGQAGIRMFVNEAKKGLVKSVDLKAGSNVTLTHSIVNGLDTITFASTGGGGSGSTLSVETPVGTQDSSNKIFTVSNTPVFVVFDGQVLTNGNGYSYSAGTITFDNAPAPSSILISFYNASSGTGTWVFNATPTGTVNNSNLIFTIPAASQVVVYRDGIRVQGGGIDYTFSATTTITFVANGAPGSAISVDYLPI